MNQVHITCPHCKFEKDVDRQKIPDHIKTIKCPRCQNSFPFELPKEEFMIEDLPPETSDSGPSVPPTAAASAHFKFCSNCGNKIHEKAEICPRCGVRVAPQANAINKVALLLITFFLGGVGGHKFYTKKYLLGTLYFLFFWTYIPTLVAFVEFIIYAVKSEAELQQKYPETSGTAMVLAVIVPLISISVIGILAAIAIPQFAAYRQKAYDSAAKNDLSACQNQVENYFTSNGAYPAGAGQIQCQTANCVALYYIPISTDEYQLISFHDKGRKAFLVDAADVSIVEEQKDDIELEIEQTFGKAALERKFHVLE